MAQSSKQIQTQTQQQVQTLSPQQIMVVKLLELPALELEDRVRAELLENPALEEGHEDAHEDEDYANAQIEFGFAQIYLEMAHALGEDIQTYDITENKLDAK